MGLFGKIGNFFKGLFGGSRSSSTTTYEPDRARAAQIEADAKVKAAEIEADTKIRLAHMENERIELMKQARLDILQNETESQIALEQAKAQGFAVMAQTIVAMQEKLNQIAEKRLLIIEKGSLQIVKDIENFYYELEEKIQKDDDRYNTEKLPELLSLLDKYQEGTPAYNLYMKRIEEDMSMQVKHTLRQIDSLHERQTQIIDSFLSSKDRIIEQTGQITVGMLEAVQKQALALGTSAANAMAENEKTLPQSERLLLTEKAQ